MDQVVQFVLPCRFWKRDGMDVIVDIEIRVVFEAGAVESPAHRGWPLLVFRELL